MGQLAIEQFKTKIKQDFVRLLDLLAHVLKADNCLSFGDADDNERLLIARGLTDKFVNHAVTLIYLSRGTHQDLPSFKFTLFDFASIDVLTRVLLEACLTFHYVFYVPKTKEEKDYRYWAYKAAGIMERQNYPATNAEFIQKLENEKMELSRLHDKMRSNVVFQGLTDKLKKRILRGEWRLKSWREIAIDAGFSDMLASDMYKYLSGYAHSSHLSVLQSVEIQSSKKQEQAIIGSQSIASAVIANMTKEYCGLFPRAHEIWSTDHGAREIVDWWIHVDRSLNDLTSEAQASD